MHSISNILKAFRQSGKKCEGNPSKCKAIISTFNMDIFISSFASDIYDLHDFQQFSNAMVVELTLLDHKENGKAFFLAIPQEYVENYFFYIINVKKINTVDFTFNDTFCDSIPDVNLILFFFLTMDIFQKHLWNA